MNRRSQPIWIAFLPVVAISVVLLLNVILHRDAYVAKVPDAYVAPLMAQETLTTVAPVPSTTIPPEQWKTSSTNYCEVGYTASGSQTRTGVVAVSFVDWPLLRGSTWRILDGPLAGREVTVEDKGSAAHFDIWVPSCDDARAYGRRTITVERVR